MQAPFKANLQHPGQADPVNGENLRLQLQWHADTA